MVSVAQLVLILDITVVNVALPDLGADLGLSRSAFTWAVSAYVPVGVALLAAIPAVVPPCPPPSPPWPRCSRYALYGQESHR